MLRNDQIWQLASPCLSILLCSPLLHSDHPISVALAAGLLVSGTGECPHLDDPSVPDVSVEMLPGPYHSCDGAVSGGVIKRLLHCVPVLPELQPLDCHRFNGCMK